MQTSLLYHSYSNVHRPLAKSIQFFSRPTVNTVHLAEIEIVFLEGEGEDGCSFVFAFFFKRKINT